jgi:hypothetical protein
MLDKAKLKCSQGYIMYPILRRLALLGLAAGAAGALPGQYTDVPDTVAPGRFLIEVDALDISVDREADFDYTAIGVGSVLLTTGVTANLDVQLGAQLFHTHRLEYDTFTDSDSGLGAVLVRSKWRFFSNEYTTISLLPYVRIPTDSDAPGTDKVEGGVIVPWSAWLPGGVEFGAQAGIDFGRNGADDGYDIDWGASAFLRRALPAGFGLYAEAMTWHTTGGEPSAGSLGAGVTLHTVIGDWDYGMYKGVSDGASDWTYTLRYSFGF